ncbi:hypothetical protein [Streptomyces sp. NPDC053048]|uniref:hypothetical protein n=1 Tax=Streptomyces sp. NPDC053048 TaxID=3365694 RepID=UPI0037CD1F25
MPPAREREPLRPADLPAPYGPDDSGEPGELGCLRLVLGVPLVILHLLSAACVTGAYMTRPNGVWDDGAYAGISAVCLVALALSALALLLTLTPSARRILGLWWMAPPLVLIGLAILRMKTL